MDRYEGREKRRSANGQGENVSLYEFLALFFSLLLVPSCFGYMHGRKGPLMVGYVGGDVPVEFLFGIALISLCMVRLYMIALVGVCYLGIFLYNVFKGAGLNRRFVELNHVNRGIGRSKT